MKDKHIPLVDLIARTKVLASKSVIDSNLKGHEKFTELQAVIENCLKIAKLCETEQNKSILETIEKIGLERFG